MDTQGIFCDETFWSQATFDWGSLKNVQGTAVGCKTACFFKLYLLPKFMPYMDVTYLIGNLKSKAIKKDTEF
jgi:hypothetical protein